MIARRTVVGGLALCGSGLGCAVHAQWPNSGAGAAPTTRVDVPVGGCGMNLAEARQFAQQWRISEDLDADPDDEAASRVALVLERYFAQCSFAGEDWFGVKPRFGFFDDGKSPNAFATPFPLFGNRADVDGTVVFGRRLLAQQLQRGNAAFAAIMVIVAHEYAHAYQFRQRRGGKCPEIELEADFLAGWSLACEAGKRQGQRLRVDLASSAATMFEFGSYDFNNPSFHGTPEQRRDALLAGYRAGDSGMSLADAYRTSIRSTA